MYEPGLLKVLDPKCPTMDVEGDCDDWDHKHKMRDSRSGDGWHQVPDLCVYLPHSCDEWVIGGKKEVKALIKDLQAILDKHGE